MKNFNILVLLFTMALFIASCGGDSDDPKPNTTTPPTGETPPSKPNSRNGASNSDLKTGTFELNGNTFQSPNTLGSASGKHKVGKLTQSGRKSSGGKMAADDDFAWLVDAVSLDGQSIDFIGDPDLGLDVAIFFLEDGTYDIYDFPNDEWDWGYWYATEDATLLVFDPETEYELIFDIASLNSTSMELTITDEGTEYALELNAYSEGEGEFTDDIDVTEVDGYFKSVFWELDGAGYYDGDGNYLYVTDGLPDITAYFTEAGEAFLASQDGVFDENTGENATEIEIASYTIDIDNFIVTFNYSDQTTEDLYLIYIDESEMVFAQADEATGEYYEYVFSPIDLASFESSIADYNYNLYGYYDETGGLSFSQDFLSITFNADGTYDYEDDLDIGSGTYTVSGDGGGVSMTLDGGLAGEALVLFYNQNNLVLELSDGDVVLLY